MTSSVESKSDLSEEFKRRESSIIRTIQSASARLKSPQACQHLFDGFQRRVLLNQTSRFRINEIVDPKRTDVLDPYTCSDLNVHLNSFFVQLRGGLDNLAWTLHYEFGVLGQGDETDRDLRRKCGLFDRRFLQALEPLQPKLVAVLRAKQDWFTLFTDLRDPVAHRVPLFAMPGVIRHGSPEAQRHAALQQEIKSAIEAQDFERLTSNMFESFRVGNYEPWFTQYGPEENAIREIRWQIDHDHAEFLEIGEAVLAILFS